MAGILFVHEGADFARRTFRDEGRAYWAAGFPVVLEQHGYLRHTVAGPEALRDPETFRWFDAIVVARLAEERWTDEVVERVVEGPAETLIDGPPPSPLAARLGIAVTGAFEHEGRLLPAPELRAEARETFGVEPEAHVGAMSVKDMPRDEALDWTAFPDVAIAHERATAWAQPSWDVAKMSAPAGSEVLAEWLAPNGTRTPALVRVGRVTVAAATFVSYSAQRHTSEPYRPGEFRSCTPSVGLEALLLTLVDRMCRRAGRIRARLLPWPQGMSYVLTVRHDFDRPLQPSQVDDVLRRHAGVGTAATWYWRASHLGADAPGGRLLARLLGSASGTHAANNDAVRRVAAAEHHEVALHTERLWPNGTAERDLVERVAGAAVRGATSHGARDCFRYQGAPNVLWAERQHLDYTELIQQAHFHPHRFLSLSADGTVEALRMLCMPKHLSLDRTVRPGDVYTEQILAALPRWQAAGGLLQVMNHPDIHLEELFDLLGSIPHEGRLDWTAAEAMAWWRATHVSGQLELRLTGSAVAIETASPVRGAVVELLMPDGRRERRYVSSEGNGVR